jgi:hypothetical protein
MSDGHTARALGNAVRRARVDRQGHNELGASSRVPPTWREKRGSGEGAGRRDGGKCACEAGARWIGVGRAAVRT